MGLVDKTLILSSYVIRRALSAGDAFCEAVACQAHVNSGFPLELFESRTNVRERYDETSRLALSAGLMAGQFRAFKDYLREYDKWLLADAGSLG
ncbi:MAG: hypothetical protein AABW80_02240 [Nanoarchaeota archaeon]